MSATVLRTAAARPLPRQLYSFHTTSSKSLLTSRTFLAYLKTAQRPVKTSTHLFVALRQPVQKSLIRYQTNWGLDKNAEAEWAKRRLQPEPELVSTESSVHNVRSETGTPEPEQDIDMMAGIRSDMVS